MKKQILTLSTIVALGISVSACTQTEQRTAGYGMSGAALGALAGGAISGTPRGAITGAAIGAAGGSIYGTSLNQGHRRQQYYIEEPRYHKPVVRHNGLPAPKSTTHRGVRYCDYKDANGESYKAPC